MNCGGWHQVQDIIERQACFPESVVLDIFLPKTCDLLFDWTILLVGFSTRSSAALQGIQNSLFAWFDHDLVGKFMAEGSEQWQIAATSQCGPSNISHKDKSIDQPASGCELANPLQILLGVLEIKQRAAHHDFVQLSDKLLTHSECLKRDEKLGISGMGLTATGNHASNPIDWMP